MEKLRSMNFIPLSPSLTLYLWGFLGAFLFLLTGFVGFNTFQFEGYRMDIFEFARFGQAAYIVPPGVAVVENSLQFYVALTLIIVFAFLFCGIFMVAAEGRNHKNQLEKNELSWRQYHYK